MKKKKKSRRRFRKLWPGIMMLLALAAVLLMPEDRFQSLKDRFAPDPVVPVSHGTPTAPEVPRDAGTLTVQVLDVGQGDSILITTGDTAVLIDGGEYAAAPVICDALRQQGIGKLDAVILTHPHSDHYGGLRPVLERFSADAFYTAAVPADQLPTVTSYARLIETLSKQKIPSSYLAAGDTLAVGQGSLTVLSPAKGARYDSLNNYSLVLRLEFGSTAFLFAGDAEMQVEEQLLLSGGSLAADVFKAGHHGSTSSCTEAFVTAVSPRIAVITVGADNRYDLPKESVLACLTEQGAALYRTDLQGCVTITTDGSELTASTEK